jgi:hypothetical protein
MTQRKVFNKPNSAFAGWAPARFAAKPGPGSARISVCQRFRKTLWPTDFMFKHSNLSPRHSNTGRIRRRLRILSIIE